MEYSNFNITVVGLGLIGGSLAMAINKKVKPKCLWGVDIDKEALNLAEAMGIIDRGFTEPTEPVQKSDFVFICLYPKATVEFIKENMPYFKPGAVISDVAGLKEAIIREISPIIRDDIDFIGGHPMAGNEFKGFKFASEKIFEGANYIITPSARNNKVNISALKNMVLKIGCANIVEMTPEEHDDIVAFTSHLPHIMALSLVLNPVIEKKFIFTGSSFRDATRVAKLNSDLWAELLLENGSNVIKYLETFEGNLREFKKAILNNDNRSLRELFARACRLKEALELNANSQCKVKG